MKAYVVVAAALTIVAAATAPGRAQAACTPAPEAGCRLTTGLHETWMTYFETGKTDPDDVYTWAWHGGTETLVEDFGNPATTGYAFCIYDGSDRPQPVVGAVPAPDASKWSTLSNGFLYRVYGDQKLRKLILRAKHGGRGKLLAHGDSTTITRVLPFVAPVTVQLQAGNGHCWESDFVRPNRSDGHAFRVE